MNAATMPQPNLVYHPRLVSQETFVEMLRQANASGRLVSYIGYEKTAAHIRNISSVSVPISRAKTEVQPGDVLLICKLRYRLENPEEKHLPSAQAAIGTDDFEYWVVEVQAPQENSD